MSTTIENILDTFEHLPDAQKRELASEIIKRTIKLDLPPLSDDELVLQAEALFLELDERESVNE